MDDFSPLMSLLQKEKTSEIQIPSTAPITKEKPKKKVNDSHAFLFIIAIFALGLTLTVLQNSGMTGHLVQEEIRESMQGNGLFNASTSIDLIFRGNVTSFKVTGEFIGNGTAKIYLGDSLIIDYSGLQDSQEDATGGLPGPDESLVQTEEVVNETSIQVNESISDDTMQNDATLNDTTLIDTAQDGSADSENNSENAIAIEPKVDIITPFEDYCLDTCLVNLPENAPLLIVLEDMQLNLSSITYTYLTGVTEESASISNETDGLNETTANETTTEPEPIDLTNITQEPIVNITDLNFTENATTNITLNITLNETNTSFENNITINDTNITIEVPQNLTENITNNITQEESYIALTAFEKFNQSITEKGLKILSYNDELENYEIGLDERNYVAFSGANITGFDVGIVEGNDDRLTSKVILINKTTGTADAYIESGIADTILRCVQFTNSSCKRWEKTDLEFAYEDGLLSFAASESGIYTAAYISLEKKEFIPASTVYYNSDCKYCEHPYSCNADRFCVMQNALDEKITFSAQFDFDILELDDSWEEAEVCAYSYYNSDVPAINYLKDSPESFCSGLSNGNSTSDIISYKVIAPENGWTCIDAADILRNAQSYSYSNVFISWLGQDMQGTNHPLNCYLGNSAISNCGNYNPSGADDCKPYLKLTYK